jgi:hypothetical protein
MFFAAIGRDEVDVALDQRRLGDDRERMLVLPRAPRGCCA